MEKSSWMMVESDDEVIVHFVLPSVEKYMDDV